VETESFEGKRTRMNDDETVRLYTIR